MRVLVTGLSGQDGSYLAEALTGRGDEVLSPGDADLARSGAGAALVRELEPELIFNLAALSSVYRSWQEPVLTAQLNGLLVAELLDAARELGARFVQASSAEIFGAPDTSPQNERTPIRPTSPYGAAKAYAHGLVHAYRSAGLGASSVILYNHESPRRPETFVTRKITAAAARIAAGRQDALTLGNLDARRDWGWAPDYVRAMMLAAEHPGDYVIATGESHSISDFAACAFERVGIDDWQRYVRTDDELLRPGDAPDLRGDASLARRVLGWEPTMGFEQIVHAMVDADVARL
jgi:GDPmannose 4,6-dehydratase